MRPTTTARITARSVVPGHTIIRDGCQYRAVGEPGEGHTVHIPCRIIRGNGTVRAGRNVTLTFGSMDPVDVITGWQE